MRVRFPRGDEVTLETVTSWPAPQRITRRDPYPTGRRWKTGSDPVSPHRDCDDAVAARYGYEAGSPPDRRDARHPLGHVAARRPTCRRCPPRRAARSARERLRRPPPQRFRSARPASWPSVELAGHPIGTSWDSSTARRRPRGDARSPWAATSYSSIPHDDPRRGTPHRVAGGAAQIGHADLETKHPPGCRCSAAGRKHSTGPLVREVHDRVEDHVD